MKFYETTDVRHAKHTVTNTLPEEYSRGSFSPLTWPEMQP